MRLIPSSVAFLAAISSVLGSCDSNSSPTVDASPPIADASLGTDAPNIAIDAAATSTCGSGKNETQCVISAEICVVEDLGGTILSSCEPLPAGCQSRDCSDCSSLCDSPADTCDDDAASNTISCVCLSC
ncbi:MAG: hypothetical protein JKY56_03695 [Kofleriaceae bacterium]|nr:hypothetical protein [Kofleriaceae bacterium]